MNCLTAIIVAKMKQSEVCEKNRVPDTRQMKCVVVGKRTSNGAIKSANIFADG